MARANVKISVSKVLDLLRIKASQVQKAIDDFESEQEKHKKALAAWQKSVVAGIPKSAKPQSVSVNVPHYGENSGKTVVEVTYVLDKVATKRPDNPERPSVYELRELEKTIKLLELTDDEFVSAGVYRNIAELL